MPRTYPPPRVVNIYPNGQTREEWRAAVLADPVRRKPIGDLFLSCLDEMMRKAAADAQEKKAS